MIINEVIRSLQSLVYKNERSHKFEIYSTIIKKTVDNLEEYSKASHYSDVVDKVQGRIHNSELSSFVNALKNRIQLHLKSFREILHYIASQISNLTHASTGFRCNLSDVNAID